MANQVSCLVNTKVTMVSISNMQESKGYLSKKHIELFLLTISTYISNRAGRNKAIAGVLAYVSIRIKGAD